MASAAKRFLLIDKTTKRTVGMRVKLSPWYSEFRRGTIVGIMNQGDYVIVNWDDKTFSLIKGEVLHQSFGADFTSLPYYDVVPVGPHPKQLLDH